MSEELGVVEVEVVADVRGEERERPLVGLVDRVQPEQDDEREQRHLAAR